jgi:hypothetical protein
MYAVMKPSAVVICLVVLPVVAAGQSLGEAAKKERERRDKLRRAGVTTRTLTEEDVATTKGRLANDPNEQPASEAGDTAKSEDGPVASALETVPEDAPSGRGEGYWRARVASARARVANVQHRHDTLQAIIRLGQPAAYDENGKRVIYSIHQLKAKADVAAAELASAQKALEAVLEDARRSGALPGWLR